MHKFLVSLLFQSFLILALVFFVLQMTMEIEGTSFTLVIPYLPTIALVVLGFANFFTFKRFNVSTRHMPNITKTEDEREQAILNEKSLFVFQSVLPFITLIGVTVVIIGFVLSSDAINVLDLQGLIRLIGITLIVMLSLPGLLQTALTILKINRQS